MRGARRGAGDAAQPPRRDGSAGVGGGARSRRLRRQRRRGARAACKDTAATLTGDLAVGLVGGGTLASADRDNELVGHELAAERIGALLRVWPDHPSRAPLLYVRARALLESGRKQEALAILPP